MLPYASLARADDPAWWNEDNYSQTVADDLKTAYGFLAQGGKRTANYLRALEMLRPLLETLAESPLEALAESPLEALAESPLEMPQEGPPLEIAPHQREHVFYVCMMGYAAEGDYVRALFCLDEALEQALQLEEWGDICELLYLRSANHRALLRFKEACEDIDECLEFLPDPPPPGAETAHVAFQLILLAQQAGYLYFLNDYARADQVIAQARRLVPLAPHLRFEAATIEWAQAHLCRTRGDPAHALLLALSVCTVYDQVANPVSQGRIHCFVANVALDLAESLSGGATGADGKSLVMLARPHLRRAERLAREARDKPGAGTAQLARARYARLTGSTRNSKALIEAVLREARQLKDDAVIAQALTALGDEWVAQGDLEAALACYKDVVGILDGSEIPAQAIRARRAIHKAREMAETRDEDPHRDDPHDGLDGHSSRDAP